MAASAANNTSLMADDGGAGRPSIFELVSQHGFAHALRPAFAHIVKTLAQKYPEGAIPFFYRNFDEVYLAFDSLVQWHYILTRGASLSEAFYGLERKFTSSSDGNRKMRMRLSYILTVILPYIKNKIEKLSAEYENPPPPPPTSSETENNNSSSQITRKELLLRFLLKHYNFIKGFIAVINFFYLIRYSFRYSNTHNVIFHLLGMRLAYASPDRAKFIGEKRSELFRADSWNLRRLPVLIMRTLGESVLFGVEMGSFFAQFLDWWYNDPRSERVVLTSLPVPPPPNSDSVQNFLKIGENDKDKCPLCRKKFRNPTTLVTSGVVYCYGCIVPYLRQDGKCPLTSLKSTMEHLIRIYP